MDSGEQSISKWLQGLKQGESLCAQHLYRDVYDRLVRLARRRLSGHPLRMADEEDVALSAFHSFCDRAAKEQFPQLENRDDLWRILVKITVRKSKDYVRASKRLKRGGGDVRGESIFVGADGSADGGNGLPQAAVDVDTPEMLAAVAEECRRLLDLLGDDTLRQIAVWKMEGYTDAQIAKELNCVVRTVERKTERIRDKWRRIAQAGDDAAQERPGA